VAVAVDMVLVADVADTMFVMDADDDWLVGILSQMVAVRFVHHNSCMSAYPLRLHFYNSNKIDYSSLSLFLIYWSALLYYQFLQ